jgi:proline iminopeptidase
VRCFRSPFGSLERTRRWRFCCTFTGPGICLHTNELVVQPGLGRIFYRCAVGPARRRQDLSTEPVKIAPTLTLKRMVADAEEMAPWTQNALGQKRIFLSGHSWGSYLGLNIARRHPEWLHAYIGVGQMTNMPESERRGWTSAMEASRSTGNVEAVSQLESIAPYPPPGGLIPLTNVYTQRRWVKFYGGTMAYREGNKAEGDLADLSPDYTDLEVSHIWEGNTFSERYLLPEFLGLDLSGIRKLGCPLLVFAGRHDFNVNSQLAEDWVASVDAPAKHFVWFENSAHLPMTEEPGKYLLSLVHLARPIAIRAEDAGHS